MSSHDHILRRYCPALTEAENTGHKRIEDALKELREAAKGLPLQQAMDIATAVMDIEAALAPKTEE